MKKRDITKFDTQTFRNRKVATVILGDDGKIAFDGPASAFPKSIVVGSDESGQVVSVTPSDGESYFEALGAYSLGPNWGISEIREE